MQNFSAIFKGVVSVREENGLYTPLRFTQKQLDRYANNTFIPGCPYAYATAGITMEFTTDAEEIVFSYECGEIWNWWEDSNPRFDIYENGSLRNHVLIEKEGGTVTYKTQECGVSTLKIQLPHNAEIKIKDLKIGNFIPVPVKDRRLLIVSDSIGQGLMGNAGNMNYATHLANLFDMDVLNQSVGGDTYDCTKVDEDLEYDPTDIIISLGINDTVSPASWEQLKSNIEIFFNKIDKLYHGKNIVVITPTMPFGFLPEAIAATPDEPLLEGSRPREERFDTLNYIREQVSINVKAKGYKLVNGQEALPLLPRYLSDDCHPNDLGFAVMALALAKEFMK